MLIPFGGIDTVPKNIFSASSVIFLATHLSSTKRKIFEKRKIQQKKCSINLTLNSEYLISIKIKDFSSARFVRFSRENLASSIIRIE
jgi:hypothetical protein